MKILAFDTSTMAVTVAVLEDEKIIAQYHLEGQVRHSEAMIQMIEEIFSHLTFTLNDLDLIAVGLGPGSFTGLRISVTAGKILSQALNIPLKGVSSLESLCYQVEGDGIIVPIFDARRHRLYSSCFEKKGRKIIRISKDEARDIDDLVQEVSTYKNPIFIGDGLQSAKEELEKKLPKGKFISQHNSSVRASSIGFLGKIRYLEEGGDNLYEMEPNYLRPSQAMREYRSKHGKDAKI